VTTKRLMRPLFLLLGSAVLWGVPITAAHACHSAPPQEAPGSQQSPGSSQVSSESANTSQNCFRRYNGACNQARQDHNRQSPED